MADQVSPEFIALQQVLLGRYSLERELGRGGMGIVFLARDVALDRQVAIKLLPPQLANQSGTRERFLREARLSAKLSHPNIIPIFLVEQSGDLVYFVMAYVEGETLGQRVRSRGPLNAGAATKLLQETAWALAYAHLRGVVHRDVKPDNIMIEQGTARAVVSDFGIARATETSGGTSVGEILGTAHYMSPEQACGEAVDGRSDIYSLGIVGFFALSGKLPFDAPDIPALLAQQITKPPPPLASAAPGVPQRLAAAIDRCLEKDPGRRWQSGEQFADALTESIVAKRELPAPVRVWLTKGEAARSGLAVWTGFCGMIAVVEAIEAVVEGGAYDTDVLWMIAVPLAIFALYRSLQTQRVIAAGYGLEDLRMALRQQLEQRREELDYEYGHEPSLLGRSLRWLAGLGLASVLAGTIYAVRAEMPHAAVGAWLLGGGSAIAIGAALLGRVFPGRRMRGRDVLLEWRLKFADSWIGRAAFKLSSVGVKPARGVAASANRPTEVAIGMAAEALFQALPKEARRQLKDLPAVIKRLEADAMAQRSRADELAAVASGLDGAPRSATLSGSAGAVVADQQARLASDVRAGREEALRRMAASVAALENLRLDLLRLKAGAGSLDELTAHLSDARRLQEDINLAIEAKREAEELTERTR